MADSESIEATPPLADRYELEEIIGEGANATTYLATDRETDRRCAVKELRIAEAESFEVIRLFEREASVLAELDHPGIPRYFDEFRVEDDRGVALCIVQEYVDGPTLEEAASGKNRALRIRGRPTRRAVADRRGLDEDGGSQDPGPARGDPVPVLYDPGEPQDNIGVVDYLS